MLGQTDAVDLSKLPLGPSLLIPELVREGKATYAPIMVDTQAQIQDWLRRYWVWVAAGGGLVLLLAMGKRKR